MNDTECTLAEQPYDALPLIERIITDHSVPRTYRWAEAEGPLRDWAEHPRGTLLLTGPTGTGKTHQAYAMCMAFLRAHWIDDSSGWAEDFPRPLGGSAMAVVACPTLLSHQAPARGISWDEQSARTMTFRSWQRAAILVIDDLYVPEAGDKRSWRREALTDLLDYRYNQRLPTIVTTNHGVGDIQAGWGDRVHSRIAGVVVPIMGRDRRIAMLDFG